MTDLQQMDDVSHDRIKSQVADLQLVMAEVLNRLESVEKKHTALCEVLGAEELAPESVLAAGFKAFAEESRERHTRREK